MRKCTYLIMPLMAALCVLTACSDDDSDAPYPPLITEMVLMRVDGALRPTIYTDGGATYRVTNQLSGVRANIVGRALCGYVPAADGTAEIYSYQGVRILQDYTQKPSEIRHDATGFVSAWRGASFVNLHLLPKTQGRLSDHSWGFVIQGQTENAAGGTTYRLSLHHDQAGDPQAYSNDLYLSLSLDSVAQDFSDHDSLELAVETFAGTETLTFGK